MLTRDGKFSKTMKMDKNSNRNSYNVSCDTLVTLASGFGKSAIGTIQIIGPNADKLVSEFFSEKLPANFGQIKLGKFMDESGDIIDQILLVKLPITDDCINEAQTKSKNSINQHEKEQIAQREQRCDNIKSAIYEITTHGGIRILQRIIETFERAGAKFIDTEELISSEQIISQTYQLNNIVARQAYKLLPKAQSPLAVKFLLYQAHNGLSELISCNDKQRIEQAFIYWPAIKYLVNGLRVVIVGPPNAGKSTLTNALGQLEHALVADFPGTTRDYVSVNALIGDLPVELIDTAGLGQTKDILHEQAERQTIRQIDKADVIFAVIDSTDLSVSKQFFEKLSDITDNQSRIVYLINKIDSQNSVMPDFLPASQPILKISALNNIGLGTIANVLWEFVGLKSFNYRMPTIFTEHLALYFSGQTN